jgi:serine/threonine-protein kinase HipA
MAWEATALDLAASAGVTVPGHRLVGIDGSHVLLLDRFDRAARPDGTTGRIGYISAMTLLEHHDGESADYLDIAESLEEVSANPKHDARQLFRRVAVSVGLNNTDDHLRNHGFLRSRAGWTLSPAFDVNPNPNNDTRQSTIAGADTAADAADGLRELASACRLTREQADTQLSTIAEAIAGWRNSALRNGVRRSELHRFEHSFDTGIRTLLNAAQPEPTVVPLAGPTSGSTS